ncbi:MAG: hypothetical protein H0V12_00100 [Chloroflexi bacterium]|nr:hypothetical protein [Chloroflexota bacterium]
MTIPAAVDLDGWQQTLTTWGPRVYAVVVVLLFAVLLLNAKRGEAGLFALCAVGVAWLLFADGTDTLSRLADHLSAIAERPAESTR